MIDLNKYYKLLNRLQQTISNFVYQILIINVIFFFSKNKTYSTYSERLNSKTLKKSFLRIVE